jgi:hypothetical protein
VLFQNVRVLSSGPVTGTTSNTKSDVPQAVVTLALVKDQPKAIVLAQQAAGAGALWFGLLPTEKADPDDGNLFQGVRSGGQE